MLFVCNLCVLRFMCRVDGKSTKSDRTAVFGTLSPLEQARTQSLQLALGGETRTQSFRLPHTLGTSEDSSHFSSLVPSGLGPPQRLELLSHFDCVPRTRTVTLTSLAMLQATTNRVEQAFKQADNTIMEACMYDTYPRYGEAKHWHSPSLRSAAAA